MLRIGHIFFCHSILRGAGSHVGHHRGWSPPVPVSGEAEHGGDSLVERDTMVAFEPCLGSAQVTPREFTA